MSFKEARKRAGLTQEQVAKLCGVTKAAVSLWETGEGFPEAKRLPEIAALYSCTIDELMSE